MRLFIVLLSFLIFSNSTFGQIFAISNEEVSRIQIQRPPKSLLYPIGNLSKDVVLLYEDLKMDTNNEVYSYSNTNWIPTPIIGFKSLISGYTTNFKFSDGFLFYSTYYSEPISLNGYSKTFLHYESKTYYLDSISNSDKKIHTSFSSDGKLLLVNTLNTLSDYYNPQQDNQIYVYDLSNLENEEIKKSTIPCTHCSDSYLVENQLFFTIGREDGYGGFANKDIYVAPWDKLEDSVKIASNTDILAVSPDGKYILGTRFFDRYKTTAVIIDVEQKKYQMLLGRDYAEYRAFYSYHETKFAFKIKDYLVYIDFPKEYPFDALKWRNEEIPDWTEKEFWAQYVHPPLPD